MKAAQPVCHANSFNPTVPGNHFEGVFLRSNQRADAHNQQRHLHLLIKTEIGEWHNCALFKLMHPVESHRSPPSNDYYPSGVRCKKREHDPVGVGAISPGCAARPVELETGHLPKSRAINFRTATGPWSSCSISGPFAGSTFVQLWPVGDETSRFS